MPQPGRKANKGGCQTSSFLHNEEQSEVEVETVGI